MKNNIKNEIKNNFSMIPNALILDNSISDRARFVYCLLSSKPDSWVFYNNALAKELQYTVDTLRKYMKELIDKGWIDKVSHPGGSNDYIIKHTNLEVVGKNTRGEKTHGFFSYPNKEVLEVKSTLKKKEQVVGDARAKISDDTKKDVMWWVGFFVNKKGFKIHEAQTKNTVPMFLDWIKQGVEVADVETAMITAHHVFGDIERCDSPIGYKNFVNEVMACKQNQTDGVNKSKPRGNHNGQHNNSVSSAEWDNANF